MISLLIILALVTVPLALIAKLSFTVLARLLGVVSQSEVATRAEFARIREQLLATATHEQPPAENVSNASVVSQGANALERSVGSEVKQPDGAPHARASMGRSTEHLLGEPTTTQWRGCPTCAASVPGTASVCLQCGARLNPPSGTA